MDRGLTPRQLLALGVAALLAAGAIVSAALGADSVATALIAALIFVVFVVLVQVHRRLGRGIDQLSSLRVLEGRRYLTLRSEVGRMREAARRSDERQTDRRD